MAGILKRLQTQLKLWIFQTDEKSIGGVQLVALRVVRFFHLLIRLFLEDRVAHRASSLTYTTILSIFPLLAVITAMGAVVTGGAKGLEDEIISYIERRMMPSLEISADGIIPLQRLAEMEKQRETLRELTESIRTMFLAFRNNATRIGFMGFLGVLVAAGLLYSTIENSFNEMWKVYGKRKILRTLTTFITLIVCTPLLIGLSVTVSVELLKFTQGKRAQSEKPAVEEVGEALPGNEEGETRSALPEIKADSTPATTTLYLQRESEQVTLLGRLAGSLIPPFLNGIFLALAYMLIPRARVYARPALIGGLAAGFIWEAAKIGFGYYVFSSTVRNALYRSLGAVPIFLVWIYFTWVVFLLGNQIVYVLQNYAGLRRERFARDAYTTLDSKLVFSVALLVAEAFERDCGGVSYEELKNDLGIRNEELQQALDLLQHHDLITRSESLLYVLKRPAHHIQVRDILAIGCNVSSLLRTPDHHPLRVEKILGQLQGCLESWNRERTLQDVLAELPASGSAQMTS